MKVKEESVKAGLNSVFETSLVVQWLRFCAPSAGGLGSVPGGGTRSTCHNKDRRSHVPQLRPSAAKSINVFLKDCYV